MQSERFHNFATTRPYLKRIFYFYPIILNGYLQKSLILSIEKQPITHD